MILGSILFVIELQVYGWCSCNSTIIKYV